MEFEESVSVQLTRNRTQMTWNRVLLPLPMEIDERPGVRGAYEVRLPPVTPVTPPAIGLSHAQWCDKILNESLPGDGFGRGCFDTLPRFVVGDPSARFETHTPLTYETNGETGQPLWKEIFGHILKECAYLTAFPNGVCYGGHSESQSARKHLKMDCHIGRLQWRGGTAVFNWWDPTMRERSCSFFRLLKRLAYIECIPPGQVHLF